MCRTNGGHVPIIRVEMFEGRSTSTKRELIEVLTRETARIAGCSPESIYIVIEDVKKENWGAGGKLCSDKYPD
ncbi:MAG: tautomerase family protein [Pseudohongiella sp.]|nr:tautomerase family protein [Pseudohongiella sp.]